MFHPVHGASWEFLQKEQTSQFEAENVDGASHLSPTSKRDQLTCTTANEREGRWVVTSSLHKRGKGSARDPVAHRHWESTVG